MRTPRLRVGLRRTAGVWRDPRPVRLPRLRGELAFLRAAETECGLPSSPLCSCRLGLFVLQPRRLQLGLFQGREREEPFLLSLSLYASPPGGTCGMDGEPRLLAPAG